MVKEVGNVVTAGITVVEGSMDILVSRLAHEDSIASLKTVARLAASSDARFADIADKFASYLLPIAAAAALVALLV